ncbi:MAG: hypothetical protein WCD43_07035 [Candidatus Acidiferrales bacterium]
MNAERSSFAGRRTHFWRIADYPCCRALAAAVLVCLFAGNSLFAQSPAISDRLPQGTLFYLQWRGKSFLGDADKKNHVLQLLEDPDFDALRQAFAKNLLQHQEKDGSAAPAVQLSDLISLLDNPAAAGLIASPAASKSGSPGDSSDLVSVFLVYDVTGKADLVKKLQASAEAAGKEKPQITTYDFGGTSIEVRVDGQNPNANTSYSARTANYFLFATQKEVIEDLVTRFSGANKPAASLAQLAEYQAVRPYIGSGAAVEYFARIPDLDKWFPADRKDQQAPKFIRNLHLDKIHAAGGGISFSGEALRAHGAVLGDTSAGSLFEVAGASSAAFQTQPVVGTASYFGISRFNFAPLYQMLRGALLATVTPQQAVGLTGAEAMAQGFLGMPVSDALQLFTGEVASQLSFTADGESQQLIALTIQKPQDVLRLLRAGLSKMIAAEDTSGDTTYLDLSYPTHDPATGQDRRGFYYLAVTPQFIFVAPRKAMVRDAVARTSGKPAAASEASILSNPDFIRLRSLMPEKLSGIGGADMSQIPWDKVITRYVQQMEQTQKQSNPKNPSSTEWLQSIKPGMFNRHLHVIATGWWKDSNGIYFDYYVQ